MTDSNGTKVNGEQTRPAKAEFVKKPKRRLEGVGEGEIDGLKIVDWLLDEPIKRSTRKPRQGRWHYAGHQARMEWGQKLRRLQKTFSLEFEREYQRLTDFLNAKVLDWTRLDDRRREIEGVHRYELESAEIAKQLEDCELEMHESTEKSMYQIALYSQLGELAVTAIKANNSRIKTCASRR